MCLAVPGELIDIEGDDPLLRTGRVRFAGVERSVSLACLPEVEVGAWVLVHVGLAIATVDAQEAARLLHALDTGDLEPLLTPAASEKGSR